MWRIRSLAVVLFLAFLTGPLVVFPGQAEYVFQKNVFHVYYVLVMLFLVLPHFPEMLARLIQKPILTLFLIFMVASSLWAVDLQFSLLSSLGYVGVAFFGIYLLGLKRLSFEKAMLATSLLCLVGSILTALLLPQARLHFVATSLESGFHLRGLYIHKNFLGRFAAFSTIFFLYFPLKMSTGKRHALFAFSMLVTLVADSMTCILALILALGSTFILTRVRVLFKPATIFLMVAGVLFSLTIVNMLPSAFFDFIGRDETLTGRSIIWAELLSAALNKPWFGYGIGGFFDVKHVDLGINFPVVEFLSHTPEAIPHAHNSFLQIMIETGLVGLSIFMLLYWNVLRNLVRFARLWNFSKLAKFHIAAFLFISFASTSEVFLPNRSIYWMMIVLWQFPEFFIKTAEGLGPSGAGVLEKVRTSEQAS